MVYNITLNKDSIIVEVTLRKDCNMGEIKNYLYDFNINYAKLTC
jgi:hypothetical protein